jgi:predicted RNA-binding protein with PUA domain
MSDAHQCPKCKLFIIGTYCFQCKEDIHEIRFDKPIEDILKDIVKGNHEDI